MTLGIDRPIGGRKRRFISVHVIRMEVSRLRVQEESQRAVEGERQRVEASSEAFVGSWIGNRGKAKASTAVVELERKAKSEFAVEVTQQEGA